MPRFSFIQFRRPLLGLVIGLMAAAAMALPSPKDIDAAVSAGQLTQAETLLREVIQEKPNSAKAHYELGQVLARQARYADAQAALSQAKALDPTLKFAASPEKFNDVFNKVSQQTKAVTGNQAAAALSAPVATAPAAPEPSFSLHYVWIGIAGLVALALILRRPKSAAPTYKAPMQSPMQAAQPAHAASYGPGQAAPAGYGPGYASGYPAGQPMGGGMGSGIGGAVVGGLAGVAAGYALSKALEGDHPSHSAPQNNGASSGYVPFEQPAQPDLGGFDAGAGNGWDDASSDAGSDDSW